MYNKDSANIEHPLPKPGTELIDCNTNPVSIFLLDSEGKILQDENNHGIIDN